MTSDEIQWKSAPFRCGKQWFRLANLDGKSPNTTVQFLLRELRSARPEIPGIDAEVIQSAGVKSIASLNQKCLKMRYHLHDKSGDIILHVVDIDFWPDLNKMRNAYADLLAELKNRKLYYGKYIFYKYEDWDDHIPWTPYDICRELISIISRESSITPSVIMRIFPPGAKRTFVAHRPGTYDCANYWDIAHAYGQVATDKIGGDAYIFTALDGKTLAYSAFGHDLEIDDSLRLIRSAPDPTWRYVMDRLNDRAYKPLRLHLMGAALTQINGRGGKIEVCRTLTGRVKSYPLHMSLKYVGRMANVAALSVRFIYEAVMAEYALSGGSCIMALTDGLMIRGSRAHRPFLLDALGIECHIKDAGAAVVHAPNCYSIGDRATVGYDGVRDLMGGVIRDREEDTEEDNPMDYRLVAIPAIMGWTAEETLKVLRAVKKLHHDAWMADGIHHVTPAWLMDIQERRAREGV